ncbi:MAG: TIGR01777 family protein [Mycobacteriaceae bacterium]|nr:TIGR01777 family protein [Mycobacteriaceae bacterium]
MRVVIAGSSGLIGTALVGSLRADGHQVVRLVRRRAAAPDEFRWDPRSGEIDAAALPGADAVVHLCGVGIGQRRWSGAVKQDLRDSRIAPTDVLASAVARTGIPVLVNAGGVNVYGDTGDRVADESAPAGTGFLAALCRDWEAAADPARRAGVRTVILRSGMVLSRHGGALGGLRLPFALGLGARLGSGRQYVSWISLDDEIGAIRHILDDERVDGPANLVGPAPVTNAAFTRALGQALNRPTLLVAPRAALRAIAGEMAEELLLTGPRAVPGVLENAGYVFRHSTIGAALAAAV